MRIRLLLSITVVLIASYGFEIIAQTDAGTPPGKLQKRPNILFVIMDDWSWPHAGAYGDKIVKTPAFDRLAREGVLFTNTYCASPSCTPSRGSILTGQTIHRLEEGANCGASFLKNLKYIPMF